MVKLGLDNAMKIKQRQSKIVEIVRKQERVTVDRLATILEISRETIRRDLTDLANSNRIRKFHGGAALPRIFGESSFQQRMSENAEAKARVAQAAAALFSAGETLFVDTGSTTLYFAEKLAENSGLTVVTNSALIARTVSGSGSNNQVFMLGGEFGADNFQTVGTMVAAQIRSFRAHHAVLTIGALDGRTGAMDFNIEEAQVARAMVEQSRSVTILMDATKFDQLASFEVCSLDSIDRLVCDSAPPQALGAALSNAGVEILVAG
jgi:DeoR/GlpR family transcriptional regulator of sugar metabolism